MANHQTVLIDKYLILIHVAKANSVNKLFARPRIFDINIGKVMRKHKVE